MQRGEIFELRTPRSPRGREQAGRRYCVILQSDALVTLSTVIVAPTSTRARSASFRPSIELEGGPNRVLLDQMTAVDPSRLGRSVGYLSYSERRSVDEAIRDVLAVG